MTIFIHTGSRTSQYGVVFHGEDHGDEADVHVEAQGFNVVGGHAPTSEESD